MPTTGNRVSRLVDNPAVMQLDDAVLARVDLREAFLPAARSIRAGHSPYEIATYVYSPLLALLL